MEKSNEIVENNREEIDISARSWYSKTKGEGNVERDYADYTADKRQAPLQYLRGRQILLRIDVGGDDEIPIEGRADHRGVASGRDSVGEWEKYRSG